MQERRSLKHGLTVAVALSMMLAATIVTAPVAHAHAGDFEHADAFQGTACPAGYTATGAPIASQIGCVPDGYSPIGSNAELCADAPFGFLVDDICTYDQPRPCGTNVVFTHPLGDGNCLRPALALNELLTSGGITRSVEPVCIEDDLVQEFAPLQSVGERFNNGERFDYLIVTGGSDCTFNCIDGWDINCDGKIGDFCNADYDRTSVDGVGRCLADMVGEPTDSMPS